MYHKCEIGKMMDNTARGSKKMRANLPVKPRAPHFVDVPQAEGGR